MKPEKEVVKDTKVRPLISNESGASDDVDSESKQTRRQFIKNLGGLIFGLTLIDRTAHQVFACPPCDSPGDNDATCNSPGDHDAGCTKGDPPGEGNYNKDEGCSASEPDESCHTKGPGLGKGDEDGSCGALGADEGCGDCNDEHDKDDNCGEPLGGGTDPDAMCGHAHTSGIDTDDNCKTAGDNDQGCGTHTGPWGTEEDDDEGCSPGPPHNSPDKNCSEIDPTSTDTDDCCVPSSKDMPNTTTPDEHCQTGGTGKPYDEDNACSQWFDIDEACGHSDTDQDQGCGGYDTSVPLVHKSDPDQNCGGTIGGGLHDADDRCGLQAGPAGDHHSDQACGDPGDPDDRCGLSVIEGRYSDQGCGKPDDPDDRCGLSHWPWPDYEDEAS